MRVVFFGSIPAARECLEIVLSHPNAEVVGVCAAQLDNWRTEQTVWDFCKERGIPLVDHDDIPALNPDIGLSVRYHRILTPETLNAFPRGVLNVHGGILPAYRGSYCNVHAILNGEERFGVTMHYINEGLDTGDVVAVLSVPVESDDTGFSLYLKGERLCVEIVRQQFPNLVDGTADRTTQQALIDAGSAANVYRRADINALREIAVDDLQSEQAMRVIRAVDSPHHEPAFCQIAGRKVYLRTTWDGA